MAQDTESTMEQELFEEQEAQHEAAARARLEEEEKNIRELQEYEQEQEDSRARESEFAAQLHANRLSDYLSVRKQIERVAARVAAKLTKEVENGHAYIVLIIVIILALIKDLLLDIGLDFLFGFGVLPIIGQIPGWFISALIFILIGRGWGKKMKLRIGLYAMGFIFDGLPLFEELPISTIIVIWWWHDVRKTARSAEKNLVELREKTPEELEALDEEYEDYEDEESEFSAGYA